MSMTWEVWMLIGFGIGAVVGALCGLIVVSALVLSREVDQVRELASEAVWPHPEWRISAP
jgi:hypothetical protein